MRRPVLYLGIVGTLLLERGGRMDLAPFARKFIDQVKERFELRFLTSLQEHQAHAVAKALNAEVGYVPYPRVIGKASVIDFQEDFFWIDDDPAPSDLLKLSDERRSNRLIPVNRRDGVVEITLKKLLGILEEQTAVEA